MSGETLPVLFSIIYVLILILTFSASLYSLYRKSHIILSIINIFVLFSVQLIFLVNSFYRVNGTELDHLMSGLSQGEAWSIYVTAGHVFMLLWWVIFLTSKVNQDHINKIEINGKIIVSLVLGILSVVFYVLPVLGVVMGICGLSFGVLGLKAINPTEPKGRGMVITGIIFSFVGAVIPVITIILNLVLNVTYIYFSV